MELLAVWLPRRQLWTIAEEDSLTRLMLVTESYLFLTRRLPGALCQGWVPKPDRWSNAVWAGTLLVLIWSQCFKPLRQSLYAISMNMKFNILARNWQFKKLETNTTVTSYMPKTRGIKMLFIPYFYSLSMQILTFVEANHLETFQMFRKMT